MSTVAEHGQAMAMTLTSPMGKSNKVVGGSIFCIVGAIGRTAKDGKQRISPERDTGSGQGGRNTIAWERCEGALALVFLINKHAGSAFGRGGPIGKHGGETATGGSN